MVEAIDAAFLPFGGGIPAIARVRDALKWRLGKLDALRTIPDKHLLWALSTIPAAVKLVRQHRPEAIYATGSPFSSLIVGSLLKRMTGLPLVADLRDPWSQDPAYREDRLRRPVDAFFESRVLKAADRVICMSPGMVRDFRRLYPWLRNGKMSASPNGFEPEDFEGMEAPAPKRSGPRVLSYLGVLFENTGGPFLNAMRRLRDRNALLSRNLRVRFIGRVGEKDRDLTTKLGLDDQVECSGRVAHREAIRTMVESDVLLLIPWAGEDGAKRIQGKLFEYLYAKVPILAVAPEGDSAHLVRQTGSGLVVDPGDAEGLTDALERIAADYDGFRSCHFRPDEARIAQYTWRQRTRTLAETLDSVSAS